MCAVARPHKGAKLCAGGLNPHQVLSASYREHGGGCEKRGSRTEVVRMDFLQDDGLELPLKHACGLNWLRKEVFPIRKVTLS